MNILLGIYLVAVAIGLINVVRVVVAMRREGLRQVYSNGRFEYKGATNGDIVHEILFGLGLTLVPIINVLYAAFILWVWTIQSKVWKGYKAWASKGIKE